MSKDSTHQAYVTAITRLMSAIFRKTDDASFIVEQLENIKDPAMTNSYWAGKNLPSIPAGIALILDYHLSREKETSKYNHMDLCEECNNHTVIKDGNCTACLSCGFSKCNK